MKAIEMFFGFGFGAVFLVFQEHDLCYLMMPVRALVEDDNSTAPIGLIHSRDLYFGGLGDANES